MSKLTEKQLVKHFGHREDHEFRGFNRALGCFVEGKEHFKCLMESGGYLPFETASLAVESAQHNKSKDYKLSPEAQEFISSIKMCADSKGKVRLGSVAIKKMEELGVSFQEVNIDEYNRF